MLQTTAEGSDVSRKNYKKLQCVFKKKKGGTSCSIERKKKGMYYCLFLIKEQFKAIKTVMQLTQASGLTQMRSEMQ